MGEESHLKSLAEVAAIQADPQRRFFSATHEEILGGLTTDVYFVRTYEILDRLGQLHTRAVAEIFATRAGVLCGVEECLNLLRGRGVEAWALDEGQPFEEKEVILRISGEYGRYGVFETLLLGFLASSSGWAGAARQCKEAAGSRRVICFGARHVHPAVAPVMERAALVGGADGASCILAARVGGRDPLGTVPHAAILILGDTVELARAYDRLMPPGVPRIILVDTFRDEAQESLEVAKALAGRLEGVRLDTPAERGGVTPWLVREVRVRLDQAGFGGVKILVSGGLNPDRIRELGAAGADSFGVGSFISGARPVDMTMDLKEIEGRPVAKRGRLPGLTPTERLRKRL